MSLKWYLPLSIHYVHFGNYKDFPIRLIVTPSSHFENSGCDVDIIVPREHVITTPDGSGFHFVKTYLVLKFNPDHHFDPQYAASAVAATTMSQKAMHLISRKASLNVNVACRMPNDYSRGCWRNGGSSHFSLLELLSNSTMSSPEKVLFTTRKVYNSGYNVADDDKLTGVVSLATYGQYSPTKEDIDAHLQTPIPTTTNANQQHRQHEEKEKWVLVARCSHNETILSCLYMRSENAPPPPPESYQSTLDRRDWVRLMFGLVIINNANSGSSVDRILDSIGSSFSPHFADYLHERPAHNTMVTKVEKEWSRYKAIMDRIFEESVEIDVACTKRMKCPWTPMDTAVIECYSDYSDSYIDTKNLADPTTKQPGTETAEGSSLEVVYSFISARLLRKSLNATRTSESSLLSSSSPSLYTTSHEKVNVNPAYLKHALWAFDDIGCISTNQQSLLKSTTTASFTSNLVRIDKEKSQRRFYLPFFAYLIHQPLLVYKNYWGVTLNILMARTIGENTANSYEAFERRFFDTKLTSYGERARLAFQLVCTYPQTLEYISDFYMTKKGKGRYHGVRRESGMFSDEVQEHGNDFGTSAAAAAAAFTDRDSQKIEIEQFWNSLRSLCGDCDDLSFAILQFYYNFVKSNEGGSHAYVTGNKVLSEMRRILRDNYILLFQIEGVYLPKQTAGAEANSSHSMYQHMSVEDRQIIHTRPYQALPAHLKNQIDAYYPDVKNMNSAHAAIKLLPKLYFERCVNRAYANSSHTPPFKHRHKHQEVSQRYHCSQNKDIDNTRTGNTTPTTCAYHLNLPDVYNEELPVLMGEGTSMLNCGDGTPDTCHNDRFKDAVLQDDLINDIMKVPIYGKKGESEFYKASLFGACLDFLDTEHVTTFTYCRSNHQKSPTVDDDDDDSTISSLLRTVGLKGSKEKDESLLRKPFLRGVSHKQLSFKSEQVILLPYGQHESSDDQTRQKHNQSIYLDELSQHACQGVAFPRPELSPFMRHLCEAECKKRVRPLKVKRTSKDYLLGSLEPDQIQPTFIKMDTNTNKNHDNLPYDYLFTKKRQDQNMLFMKLNNNTYPSPVSIHNLPQIYNMQTCDTQHTIQSRFQLLQTWCDNMNHKRDVNVSDNGAIAFSHTKNNSIGGYLNLFIDNYYVTTNFLKYLESHITTNTTSNSIFLFKTSFSLETHSSDMSIWRITLSLE